VRPALQFESLLETMVVILAALVLAGIGVLYRATGVRHLQGV
jgi:hypothetical protein